MTFFKIDGLVSWQGIMPSELLQIEAPEPRRVRLLLNTNAPTEVWASFPVEPLTMLPGGAMVLDEEPEMRDVLVAYSSGLFEVEFTTHGTTFLRCLAPEDTAIFARTFAVDMTVPPSDSEVYTTIMPRERRNTEFDRMVMWTKLNEARRDQQLQAALAALQAAQPGQAAAPQPDQVIEQASEAPADAGQ